MRAEIFAAFGEICAAEAAGGDVLEIGATPTADTLLRLPSLSDATSRTGVTLDAPYQDGTIRILTANANHMPFFEDGRFDTVLTNSTLEHDPFFWLTLGEIRRVSRPGALIVIGVPGYGEMGDVPFASLSGLMRRLPGGTRLASRLRASAATLGRHDFPSDYYRFSPAAVEAVLLAGCDDRRSRVLLQPPRIIGWGRRANG
jgi:SAM-dependent methyltransferase